ncbi:MAG: hypothetical protein K5859_09075 [Atopobiaceae bacterium]|nr:hypothetical protein [Atopobiaceae bacterium]
MTRRLPQAPSIPREQHVCGERLVEGCLGLDGLLAIAALMERRVREVDQNGCLALVDGEVDGEIWVPGIHIGTRPALLSQVVTEGVFGLERSHAAAAQVLF